MGGWEKLAVMAAGYAFHRLTEPKPSLQAPPQPPTPNIVMPPPEQRIFGVPGAALYTADKLDASMRTAGIDGEKVVAAELESLAAQYPNTYVFHSVKLPGAMGDIDHLIVQGSRMLLVDSKNWKHGPAYHVYHSDEHADYISRDGEHFEGGEIHLPRQMRQWAEAFADAYMDVQGTLVMANRVSVVSESVGIRYTFANLDGLATVFAALFSPEVAPPLHPAMLTRLLRLLQGSGAPALAPAPAPVTAPAYPAYPTRQPTPPVAAGALLWGTFNWTVGFLVFPFVGLSAIPLLAFAHWQLSRVMKNHLGGFGLLVTVIVFTYIQLALWIPVTLVGVADWLQHAGVIHL